MKVVTRKRTDVYKSNGEAWYAGSYQDVMPMPVISISYEAVKLRVAGGWYTPDFMHITSTGNVVFVEIKESKYQPSYRSSRQKLKAAAELHNWAYFCQIIPKPLSVEWINGEYESS